jgi:hypothetical protein
MKAAKQLFNMVCEDCKTTFQAKAKNAKRCPTCREKKQKEYLEHQNRSLPTAPPEPKAEPVVTPEARKRDIDIKMKGICVGRDGLLEELSKLVEMMGTWEAGEIQFAIYLRAK